MNHRGNNNSNINNSKTASSSSTIKMNHRGSSNISPYSFGTKDQRAAEVNRTVLEQENDRRWLELGEQVTLLKSVCHYFL